METTKAIKALLAALRKDAKVGLPMLDNMINQVLPNRMARMGSKMGTKGNNFLVKLKQLLRTAKSKGSMLGKKF